MSVKGLPCVKAIDKRIICLSKLSNKSKLRKLRVHGAHAFPGPSPWLGEYNWGTSTKREEANEETKKGWLFHFCCEPCGMKDIVCETETQAFSKYLS